MSAERDVAVLGVGMHPWGKWGHDFTEYGMVAGAPRAGRRRAGVERHPVRGRRRHHPQRLPGLHRRRDVRAEARLDRRARVVELCGLRVGRARAPQRAGADPGRLLRRRPRRRRRHHAQGLLRPRRRRAHQRPRLAPLPRARRHQPHVLRALRTSPDGPLRRDERRLRPGQGQELPARAREPQRPVPQGELGRRRAREPDRRRSAPSPRHLRDVRRRRGDDRVEHGLRPEPPRQRRRHPARQGGVDGDAALPADGARAARLRHRLERERARARPRLPRLDRVERVRGSRHRPRRPQPGRGLRPVHRARARLVREHRAVRGGRGRGAAALGRDHRRRPHPGEPERRARVLRRGDPRAGHRPGVRSGVATAGRGRAVARSRVPPWASPPTRVSSVTGRP